MRQISVKASLIALFLSVSFSPSAMAYDMDCGKVFSLEADESPVRTDEPSSNASKLFDKAQAAVFGNEAKTRRWEELRLVDPFIADWAAATIENFESFPGLEYAAKALTSPFWKEFLSLTPGKVRAVEDLRRHGVCSHWSGEADGPAPLWASSRLMRWAGFDILIRSRSLEMDSVLIHELAHAAYFLLDQIKPGLRKQFVAAWKKKRAELLEHLKDDPQSASWKDFHVSGKISDPKKVLEYEYSLDEYWAFAVQSFFLSEDTSIGAYRLGAKQLQNSNPEVFHILEKVFAP